MFPGKHQQTALEEFRILTPIAPRDGRAMGRTRRPDGHPFDGVIQNLDWFGKRFTTNRRADACRFRLGDRPLIAVDRKWIPLRLALRFHEVGRMRVALNLFSCLRRRLWARAWSLP